MAKQTEVHLKVKKLPSLWPEIKKSWVAYVYISPFYILFAIFGAFPILFSFYLSFHRWRGYGPMVFRGFKNYARLFHDSLFWTSLWNTVIIWIAAHVPMLLLALVLAFILNSGLVKFRRIFEAIYFTPMVTSSVAVPLTSSFAISILPPLANGPIFRPRRIKKSRSGFVSCLTDPMSSSWRHKPHARA